MSPITPETIRQVDANLVAVLKDASAAAELNEQVLKEVVAAKGYHSNAVLSDCADKEIRTYISEPDRGRRNWTGKTEEEQAAKSAARDAVYGNRRRIKGDRGRRLMKKRGELIERSFAHCYDTGGMRRTHLRGHKNILKRLLIHAAGFNLSLILRKLIGFGTARSLQGLRSAFSRAFSAIFGPMRPIDAARLRRWPLAMEFRRPTLTSPDVRAIVRYAA